MREAERSRGDQASGRARIRANRSPVRPSGRRSLRKRRRRVQGSAEVLGPESTAIVTTVWSVPGVLRRAGPRRHWRRWRCPRRAPPPREAPRHRHRLGGRHGRDLVSERAAHSGTTKPAPMPSILCTPVGPPDSTADSAGSTATTCMCARLRSQALGDPAQRAGRADALHEGVDVDRRSAAQISSAMR